MIVPTWLVLSLAFVVSLLSSSLLVPTAARLGERFGLIDRPRPGELQRDQTPRSGGYGLVAAFLVTLAISVPFISRTPDEVTRVSGLVLGIILVVPIAAIDDLKRLGPVPQLVGQVGLAAVAMAFGLTVNSIASPFGGLIVLPMAVAIPFTVIWVVGMINTLNFVDTMDGLAAGVTAIAAIVLFIRSLSLGQVSISVLPLVLAGVCVAFLRFNFNPARIFMGTSGSTFLGFSLAVLAIIGGAKIATAAFVLGLPIVDVALVIVQRSVRRRSPLVGGDSAHLPHKLSRRGFSTRRITLLIYTVCAVGGTLAMTLNGEQKLGVIAVVVAIAALLAVRFAAFRPAE